VTLPARTREDFEIAKFLPFRLTVLSNRLTRSAARIYGKKFGLTAPEWRTIAVLARSGSVTCSHVIAETTMDKVRVSHAVAKLLTAGYITREADPLDRRRVVLALTPAGHDIYHEIVPLVQEAEIEVMGNLTTEERFNFQSVLSKLETYIAKMNDVEADE
jgi:DNA-binding MarR family transcriptional regulator